MDCWGLSKRKSCSYWQLKLLLMIYILMVRQTQGDCIEEERKALLEIKASLMRTYDYEIDHFLPTWVDYGSSTPGDCCDWERVSCNTTTGHVIELSLYNLRELLEYDVELESKLWALNVSLFLHFKELTSLNLSYDFLEKEIMKTGLERLSSLKKLEVLDLSSNHDIDNDILPSLKTLTSLKILDLSRTSLNGNFPTNEFLNLFDLEVLLLNGNGFNGTIPMEAFTSFHHLRVLDLSGNNFIGSVPSAIKALYSLQALSLAYNNLNGSLSDHGLCELENLQELDLSGNMLDGILPQCLKNLSSLKLLDISSNQFSGILAPSLIANLTSLEYIDFSDNRFEGPFSFSLFSNHTKLEVVRFGRHNDKFYVETEEPIYWIPMFQLKVLVLSNCKLNMPKVRVVPGFLLHQHKLQELDMSHNSLEGQFPNWLIKNNTNLQILNLRNNSFGSMPMYWNSNMRVLDMSRNKIKSSILDDIPKFFPNIESLNLFGNALSGAIPSSIGYLSRLRGLDLSDNELSGEVPLGLLTNISGLLVLKLSKNKLYGKVLSRNTSFTHIERVHLDSNGFTGKIEIKFVYLATLDISNNFFTGVIPDWIVNMSSLFEFVVRNNSLEGRFPCGATSIVFLDISQNSFSGPIPPCSNLQNMMHLHLGSNRFTGSIPNSFRNLTNVLTLDMGNNNLSGKVPEFIGKLTNLRILLLRKNNFIGSIPKHLCHLRNASLIDLSDNSLYGSIPSCLHNIFGPTNLAFLERVMVYYNMGSTYKYGSNLSLWDSSEYYSETFGTRDEVLFTTKSMSLSYKGDILDYMTGLDLSFNNLTGEIPEELGLLINIHALNLSRNQLSGSIPVNFSNLANLESLDLSSNRLSGKVPSELSKLTFLEFLNVSHNNLSGRLPEMKAQFSTFTNASYEGNPLLCGPPLQKKCTTEPYVTDPSLEEEDTEKWYEVDMTCFYGSSSSTCVVFLFGFVTLLYVNPYWRKRWLDMIEEFMYKSYYFLYDSVTKPCMIFHK